VHQGPTEAPLGHGWRNTSASGPHLHLLWNIEYYYYEYFSSADVLWFTSVSLVPFHRGHFEVQFC